MIFNQRSNQRNYTMLITVCMSLIILISGYFVRQQIHRSILAPLEIRAELQTNYIEEVNLGTDDIESIASIVEPSGQSEKGESVVLKNGNVVWDNFSDQVRLRTLRQQLEGFQPDAVSSRIFINSYVVHSPINTSDESFQLVQSYNRSQFQTLLNDFYLWMAAIISFVLLIVFLFFKMNRNYINKPLEAMNMAISNIEDEEHLFEYIPGNLPVVDELGEGIVSLKEHLREKRGNLNSSEKRLSLLMGHLNLGVVLINNSGKIELINTEAMQLLNIDSESTQRSYQAVIKSYILVDMINDALKTYRPLNNDIEMYVPTSKYIDVNIIPYGESEEEVESILVLLYDISQVRRLETVRTEFVANASHELRTPVTAIKGFAETLLDGAIDQPELAKKFLTIIANESNRLEVIINDILELSRVEKKSEPMMVKSFDIVNVVENLVQFFYKRADKKHINITIDAEKPIIMETDQHRVEQIFTNLIDNAINYSDVDSEIGIEIKKVDDYVHFSVADTGIGIPVADQERIFERFYRVDKGRSRNSGGTGLGLSIVRNLVRNMSGTIYVESEVGEGSTFHVELPLKSKR